MKLLVVLVAAIASMGVGALWYSEAVFGKYWMKLTGLNKSDLKKEGSWVLYLMSFAALLVMAYVLSFLIDFVQIRSVGDAVKLAFWVWLGLVVTTSFTNTIFSQKPFKLFLLENGHHLLVMVLISIILVLWGNQP